MLQNFFKIAWRNLWKNRFFTFLNLFGLSLGIAVSLALILYVGRERSFDKYHQHASDIYRVGVNAEFDATQQKWASVPNIAGPTFKDKLSEVAEQVRFLRHNFGSTAFVRVNDQNYAEKDLYWVDSTLFDVFDVPLLQGNPKTALNQPNKIILCKSVSEKLFGKEDPMGKTIKVDNNLELEITGIFEDFPSNSTLDASMIGSFYSMRWATENLSWSNCSFETYLLMHTGVTQEALEQKVNQVLDEAVKKEDQWFSFWTQPLLDVHLYSARIANGGYSSRLGDITQINTLSLLALAVLLLACFNYINLTTARSQQRFREVGINKTLGASTGQMAGRFLVETGILVALAFLIGIMLVKLSSPYFESLTGQALPLFETWSFGQMGMLLGLWALITLGAGLYPALLLSTFTPKQLLQPSNTGIAGPRFFRQALVVLQFVVCIALISGAIVLNRQLKFISQKKLGFTPEQVVAITTEAAEDNSQVEALMNAYRNMPAVSSLCLAQGYPGLSVSGYSMTKPGNEEVAIGVNSNHASPGITEVLGLKLLAGQTLPEKSKEDTTVQVIINEKGVEFLGWTPEEAIGKTPPNLYQGNTTIVGVVENFHFESLHNPIGVYVFNNGNDLERSSYMLVKLSSGALQNTLQQLEETFNKYLPKSAFEFTFLDAHTRRLYQNEQQLSKLVWLFTLLTIIISCLGLFGLAAFTAERRTKEIGIRKVLGASSGSLVTLLATEFLKPVLIAVVLASPIAFFGMKHWLQNYAYRIEMSTSYLIIAGALGILIAFLTVSFQSLRAARANPIDSLRNE
ncbi:MAG: ABC transporter permease [Saprospiraceae bacterium]|nr:ABC transporter permease [Saprospiraceae bacterium]